MSQETIVTFSTKRVNSHSKILYRSLEPCRYRKVRLRFHQTQILACKSVEHYSSFKFSKKRIKSLRSDSISLKKTKKERSLTTSKEKMRKIESKDNKKTKIEVDNFLRIKARSNWTISTLKSIFLKLRMSMLLLKSFNFSKWSMNASQNYRNK